IHRRPAVTEDDLSKRAMRHHRKDSGEWPPLNRVDQPHTNSPTRRSREKTTYWGLLLPCLREEPANRPYTDSHRTCNQRNPKLIISKDLDILLGFGDTQIVGKKTRADDDPAGRFTSRSGHLV